MELANLKAKWFAEEQVSKLPTNERHFASSQVQPVLATMPGRLPVSDRKVYTPKMRQRSAPQYECLQLYR